MKRKIMQSMLAVALASMLLLLGLIMPALYRAFARRAMDEMQSTASVLAEMLKTQESPTAFLQQMQRTLPGVRVSWIDEDGAVLYDSSVAEASALENHAGRSEVLQAFATGEGSDSRLSASLGVSTYYYAKRLPDGSVLRVAKPERTITAELTGLLPLFAVIVVLVVALSYGLSRLLTRRLLGPINRLDLDHPQDSVVDEELAPLLRRLDGQNRRIQEQLRENREAAQTVAAITENMAEGLILLSAQGHIVSINQSAARLLGASSDALLGQHYMAACRDLSFHGSIEQALKGQRHESRLALSGRIFQVLADPVRGENVLTGAVVLLLDITEHALAEATRREFSANVSHELKTPLTTIAGYAEMMQSGLADAQDNAALAGKILIEARRLLALIEDIMQLSRLDEEDGPIEAAPVNLLETAQTAIDRLTPFANEKGVILSLQGTAQTIPASPTRMEEMLHNLIDNAIRYNIPGGRVDVSIDMQDARVRLQVSDTGTGIDPAHHARIFERFYRVDKSHSRQTGGTGLGLSIVKHCVQNHGGTIQLESQEGKGATFTILLPR